MHTFVTDAQHNSVHTSRWGGGHLEGRFREARVASGGDASHDDDDGDDVAAAAIFPLLLSLSFDATPFR